jgi:hypothetical protein
MRAIGMLGALPSGSGAVVSFLVPAARLHDVELRCPVPGAVAALAGRVRQVQGGTEANHDQEQLGYLT